MDIDDGRPLTIVIPYDFSDKSRTASRYAFEVFGASSCKFVIVHGYELVERNSGLKFTSLQGALRQETIDRLYTDISLISKEFFVTQGAIQYLVEFGRTDEILADFLKRRHTDFVVLSGRRSSSLFRNLHCPVINVPDRPAVQPPKSIVVAVDLQQEIKQETLRPLRHFARLFNARFTLLYITSGDMNGPFQERKERLKNMFSGQPMSFTFLSNQNVVAGIRQFLQLQQTDLLVTLPRKLNLPERLKLNHVTGSLIREMSIPMLTCSPYTVSTGDR